jgi:hypothetical protein
MSGKKFKGVEAKCPGQVLLLDDEASTCDILQVKF